MPSRTILLLLSILIVVFGKHGFIFLSQLIVVLALGMHQLLVEHIDIIVGIVGKVVFILPQVGQPFIRPACHYP